jgi:hypothetical protein
VRDVTSYGMSQLQMVGVLRQCYPADLRPAALQARGKMIGGNDLWIAAHAISAGFILVTNNEREFKRVPGLKLQNWTSRRP